MDIQRLRNLTTSKLHTDIQCVYEDLEWLTGIPGIMTHEIPGAMRAIKPWLRKVVTDERFWDGLYDPSHTGEFEIRKMTSQEVTEYFQNDMVYLV